MEPLNLHWLGPHLVESRGRPVKLETRKAAALLAYLSLNPGDCQRELLATMLWSEASQQKALANLRRTLSSLNASLPGWIEADRETISLKKNGRLWVDVQAFQAALSHLQDNDRPDQGLDEDCLAILNEALQYYRGDFLEGLNLSDSPGFDQWQSFQRDGLRQGLAKVLQCISLAYLQLSQWDQAILAARRWLALDPLHEPACRMLMDLYARSGQRLAALRQYQELEHSLQEQLAQEPEPETRQLYERILGPNETLQTAGSREHPASFPLLKTKLYIPAAPASRVVRSRLVQRLDEAGHRTLTLISAPAGFGKTTLLAEWIAQSTLPVAWLSLDNGDNDPYRFLDYLVAALECIREDAGREARQMMHFPQLVPPHLILASLLNDLGQAAEPFVLVLDDYQFITEHAIHEILAYLLDHVPANLHLVIATRADPPLQLGRLRAYGQMLELRTRDLRFTPEEAAQFLNAVMRLGLSPDDIEALEARTEGWVVGLQMAALSLKERENTSDFIRAFSGSQRYVLDYLMEEVLKRQPAHIQTFLLHTSILDRLSGPLCDALLNDDWRQSGENGQDVLEYLERSNLFVIPLDDHKLWYRFHQLFADLLRSRLTQSFADQLSLLHGRAAQWYETNDFPVEAVQHALAAQDIEEAFYLIEKHSGDIIFAGGYATVLEWIQKLPPERVENHPWLCVWLGWGILASGKLEGVDRLIAAAQKGLADILDARSGAILPENEKLSNEILTLQVSLASLLRDHSKTIDLALQVLEHIPDVTSRYHINALYPLGNAYYISGELAKAEQAYLEVRRLSEQTGYLLRHILATHKLACIQQVMGKLQESYNLYQELLGLLEKYGKQEAFGVGYVYSGMGSLLYEWDRLGEAWQMTERGRRLDELTRVPMILADGYNNMARMLIGCGDLNAAAQILEKTAQLIKEYPVLPETREMFESCRARLWLAKNDMQSATAWSQERLCCGVETLSFERELGNIALARVLISQGLLTDASRLLSKLAVSAEAGGRNGRLVEILLLQARVLQLQNKREQALRRLEQGIKSSEAGNYIRVYVDEGEWLEELLRLEHKRAGHKEPGRLAYSDGLLEAFSRKTGEFSTRMPT